MSSAWEILGIEPTENKREIKKAYAEKIAKFHPEDFPVEFQEVQVAYKSIMDSLTRNFEHKPLETIDFKEEFQKASNVYDKPVAQEQVTQYEQKNEQIESLEEKEDSIYDNLNLDWSFQNVDKKVNESVYSNAQQVDINVEHQRKVDERTQPSIYTEESNDIEIEQIDNQNDELKTHLYNQFYDRLKYSQSRDMLEILILNQVFFEQTKDIVFFHKIEQLLKSYYPKLDILAINFLYDTFRYLQEVHGFAIDEFDLPTYLKQERELYDRRLKKTMRWQKLSPYIYFGAFLIFITIILAYNSHKEQEKKEERDRIIEINARYTKEQNKLKVANQRYLNDEILAQYGGSYDCVITSIYMGKNISLPFMCIAKNEGANILSGSVLLDENAYIKEISVNGDR